MNMQRSWKLVAIDVDGTLLDSRHQLSGGAEEAIARVRDQGIEIALVSGRNKLTLMPLITRLGIVRPYIASAGAYVADPRNGAVIYHTRLARQDLEPLVALARTAVVSIFFEEPDRIIGEGAPSIIESVEIINGIEIEKTADIIREMVDTPTKVFLVGIPEELVSLSHLLHRLDNRMHVAFSLPTFIEITALGVNKGAALERVCQYLGMSPDQIVVIGDGENDLGMFRISGLSIAVGNASDQVKEEADVIVPTNDKEGVAWALRHVVL